VSQDRPARGSTRDIGWCPTMGTHRVRKNTLQGTKGRRGILVTNFNGASNRRQPIPLKYRVRGKLVV
jgi:hypothetical protein